MKALDLPKKLFEQSTVPLYEGLGESGADILQRIGSDSVFRADVVTAIQRLYTGEGAFGATGHNTKRTALTLARAIMCGTSTIDMSIILEAENIRDPETRRLLEEMPLKHKPGVVPYSAQQIAECKDTHFLVFGCPISYSSFEQHSFHLEPKLSRKRGRELLNITPTFGWYLITRNGECGGIGDHERLATLPEILFSLQFLKSLSGSSKPFRSGGMCEDGTGNGTVYFHPGGKGDTAYYLKDKSPFSPESSFKVVLPNT